MRRPHRLLVLLGASCLVPALALRAQQPTAPPRPDRPAAAKDQAAKATDPVERIKEEGLKYSQVMTPSAT